MNDWSDAVKNGIVISICCIVVSMVMGFLYLSTTESERQEEKLYATVNKVYNDYYRAYDGSVVAGQKVIGAIQQFTRTDTAVLVNNLESSNANIFTRSIGRVNGPIIDKVLPAADVEDGALELTTTNDSSKVISKNAAVNPEETGIYVNPAGKFESKLIHGVNGEIIAVYFKQIPNNAK